MGPGPWQGHKSMSRWLDIYAKAGWGLPWVLYLELLFMSSHPAKWDQGPIFKRLSLRQRWDTSNLSKPDPTEVR